MNTLTDYRTSIWKSSSFVILFSSAFFVALGSKIYDLALPLLVYELTQSSHMMGWMRAVEFLPNLLLALFIGVWVDRCDKKSWSQAMLLGQILTILLSYSAVNWMAEPLYVLFPCAFLMMTFNYGYHNARMAMLKLALPHAQQNTATARMSSLYSLMETVGPVLSGALLLLSELHQIFLGLALLWLLAYWQLNRLTLETPQVSEHPPVLQALREGSHVLYHEKNMWRITLAVMVMNTTGSIFWIQSIYVAKADLSLSAIDIGYMVAASGIGGVLSAFVADTVRRQIGLGKLLILSIALESIGFILPVLSQTPMMLIVAFFWVSAVGLFSNICIWSYRQEAFSQQHLGRIAGLTGSLFKLLMPFGLAASGYLMTRYGSTMLFSACFVVQFVVAIFLLFSRVRAIP